MWHVEVNIVAMPKAQMERGFVLADCIQAMQLVLREPMSPVAATTVATPQVQMGKRYVLVVNTPAMPLAQMAPMLPVVVNTAALPQAQTGREFVPVDCIQVMPQALRVPMSRAAENIVATLQAQMVEKSVLAGETLENDGRRVIFQITTLGKSERNSSPYKLPLLMNLRKHSFYCALDR
jgi:hypothetical protein